MRFLSAGGAKFLSPGASAPRRPGSTETNATRAEGARVALAGASYPKPQGMRALETDAAFMLVSFGIGTASEKRLVS